MTSVSEPANSQSSESVVVSATDKSGITIVVDDVSAACEDQESEKMASDSDKDREEYDKDFTVDDLTREDLGLKTDDDDDVYEELIRDFRNKMDSLSFKRLNKADIKLQAADFLAQKDQAEVEPSNGGE